MPNFPRTAAILPLLAGAAAATSLSPRVASQTPVGHDPVVVALQATDLARFNHAHVAIVDTVVYWVAGPMGNPDRPIRVERLDLRTLPVRVGRVRLVAGARRRDAMGTDSIAVYVARDTTRLERGRVVRVTVVVEPYDSYGYFAQLLLERQGQQWRVLKISYFDA